MRAAQYRRERSSLASKFPAHVCSVVAREESASFLSIRASSLKNGAMRSQNEKGYQFGTPKTHSNGRDRLSLLELISVLKIIFIARNQRQFGFSTDVRLEVGLCDFRKAAFSDGTFVNIFTEVLHVAQCLQLG